MSIPPQTQMSIGYSQVWHPAFWGLWKIMIFCCETWLTSRKIVLFFGVIFHKFFQHFKNYEICPSKNQ